MQPGSYWVAFRTIVIKEFLRFARIWIQTLLPAAVTTGLYFVIFGQLIGSQLGPVHGLSYMEYIVPGVILMAVISNSYSNVVSSFFSTKVQRHVEELLVAPVPDWVILGGYVAGGVARGLAVALVVTLVTVPFTTIELHHPLLALLVLVLTSAVFSIAGFINAVFAKSFDDVSIVPTFVLTPLTYLGGVFYSIDMLPAFWRELSVVNPILHMVDAFRYGLLGVSDLRPGFALLIISGFLLGLGVLALGLLRRGVGIKS